MSDFVNFNKRDVELPPGCTDLIHVLGGDTKGVSGGWTLPTSERKTGDFSSLRRYFERLLGPGGGALGL
jgi:hypothetical protein